MENLNSDDFNAKYRKRTQRFAIKLCLALNTIHTKEATKIVIRQLLRSGTGLAANFRAATRARSQAEYYSKICIAVEECDETQFWFEILEEADLFKNNDINILHAEVTELLKILTATKYKLKIKRYPAP